MCEMKHDIANRKDIELLVDTFYQKVKANEIIGYLFTEVAQVDWASHLPVMYAFWAGILLGERGYTGNPMQKHIELSKMAALGEPEFAAWLQLFTQTADELFEGPVAEEAKTRAGHIARLILHKIQTA